ncbi:MAG: right-handed parallel beta-helix repeat-containing protein, partial [Lentisphaerota bacterium]
GGVCIEDAATRNTVLRGNRIGSDASGLDAIPNADYGAGLVNAPFNTIGSSTNAQERNVISGNAGEGIEITGSNSYGNLVAGNYIGLDASGTSMLGNVGAGIYISQSSTNQIGGLGTGAVNRIAYNIGSGIQVESGVANLLLNNAVYRNGVLGIDLGLGTPTLNDVGDPDLGPNRYQNYPDLVSVSNNGSQIRIEWTLDSIPGETFMIEFYGSTGPDPTTYGEGEYSLGRLGPFSMPPSDILRGTNLLSTPQPPPNFITALASHATLLDTSEFSRRMLLDSDHDGMGDGFETLYFGGYTNGQPGGDADFDGFSNLSEFRADTNPQDINSFLCLNKIETARPNLVLAAPCSRERTYQVQVCTNLHKHPPEWITRSATFAYSGDDGRFTMQTTNAAVCRIAADLP